MKNKLDLYFGTLKLSYKSKITLVILMVFVIAISVIFSAYVMKVVEYLGNSIDSLVEPRIVGINDKQFNMYTFYSKGYGVHFNYENALATMHDGFLSEFAVASISLDIRKLLNTTEYGYMGSYNASVYYVYNDFMEQDVPEFTEDMLNSGKPYLSISSDILSMISELDGYQKEDGYAVGDKLLLGGVDYEIVNIEEKYGTVNLTYVDNLMIQEISNISIYTTEHLSPSAVFNLEKKCGFNESKGDYISFYVGKILGIIGVVAIFSINIFVLYTFFLRKDRLLYAEYKMLGAKNSTIILLMIFLSLPITILGIGIGMGVESIVSKYVYIGDEVVSLSLSNAMILVLVNLIIPLIAVLITAVRRAVKRPVDI